MRNPLASITVIVDNSMRVVFFAGAVLTAINHYNKNLFGDRAILHFDYFWNYFDAFGAYLAAMEAFKSAPDAKRDKAIKTALAYVDLFGAAQLAVGTTLALLGDEGVLRGTAAKVSEPLLGITFTVCMMISAFKESHLLLRAFMKTHSHDLLRDRLIKCQNLQNRIEMLQEDAEENADNISAFKEKQTVVYMQAMTIARVRFRDEQGERLNAKGVLALKYPELDGQQFLLATHRLNAPVASDIALVQFLETKQAAKVRQHTVGVFACLSAVVGMLLITEGFFFPAAMVPGIMIALVSSALKLIEVLALDRRFYHLCSEKRVDLDMNNVLVNTWVRCGSVDEWSVLSQSVHKDYASKLSTKDRGRLVEQALRQRHSIFSSNEAGEHELTPLAPDSRINVNYG